MPTRADPRPPSSGRSRPVLNSTAQGGPLYWARKAARICGEGMVFGPRCQPRPSPATPGVHTYGGCSPWHRLVWAVARERGPVATAREREPVAQHGAKARASGSLWRESAGRWPLRESASQWARAGGSLSANAPGLWPMRYVKTYVSYVRARPTSELPCAWLGGSHGAAVRAARMRTRKHGARA